MTLYDAVVVGGGPAGTSAAYHLGTRGLRVALLEKSIYPRDKACGDMLSESALRCLQTIGLGDLIETYAPADTWKAAFGAPAGYAVKRSVRTRRFGRRVWQMIPRKVLDEALARRAQAVGVDLLERVSVIAFDVSTDRVRLRATGLRDGVLEARLAVIAVGSAGKFALGKAYLFALRGYYQLRGASSSDLVLRWEADLAPGYIWRFPLPGDIANVGIYTTLQQARVLDIDQRLRTSAIATELQPLGHLSGGMVNTSFGRYPVYGDRVMYVGDAAGLVQPHLGEGISAALRSGAIAAERGVRALESGQLSAVDLSAYMQHLRDEFDREMTLSRFSHWMMQHPRLFSLVAYPLARIQATISRFPRKTPNS